MATEKTAQVFNLEGKATGKTTLPSAFDTPLRPDVIKRAVLSLQSHRLQHQGRDPMAGKRTSAESRGTGMALARVPRVKGGSGNAAFAPGTVGGRQAHPPRAEARVVKEIPKKEKHLALLSAIAATASKETVELRGHEVEGVLDIPLVVEDSLSELTKAKEVEEAFTNLGLLTDIYRVRESRGIRAGKGKHRGRKMKQAIGPLIVITENKGIVKAASNLPGVDVVTVSDLNAEVLAPGTHAGRLTVWTTSAIAEVGKLYSTGENA